MTKCQSVRTLGDLGGPVWLEHALEARAACANA
eukprot:CAMPEP_0119536458 /NCGR_PEP_ID=MMETSP1344-20130328/49290_1 /TAXON_ID=236787 /ORGANISM="Florenciella parvula, Strain CCMP2471" /LENGTH=32 /DNA_ID= /DNA_START= /DNA_END= /DNA_ORIENTATION=